MNWKPDTPVPYWILMFGRSWDFAGNIQALGVFYDYLFQPDVVANTTGSRQTKKYRNFIYHWTFSDWESSMRSYVIGGNTVSEGASPGYFGIFCKSGSLPGTIPNVINSFTLTGSRLSKD